MARIPYIYNQGFHYFGDTQLRNPEYISEPSGKQSQSGSRESTDAFNQIAPRPRNNYFFERALKAEVHDPLFMIGRQWQMGEFEFEDTGSAIFAKIAMDISRLTRIKTGGAAETYVEDIPLEARVERQPVRLSIKEKVRLGEQWMKMLEKAGIDYNANTSGTTFDFAAYQSFFLDISNPSSHYSFLPVDEIQTTDTDTDIFRKAKQLSQLKEVQYIRLISGRKVNGAAILEQISVNNAFFNSIDGGTTSFGFVEDVAADFVDWVNEIYSIPGSPSDNCWNDETLSYQAEVSSPREDDTGVAMINRVFRLRDYSSDNLDWYEFDEKPTTSADDMATIDGTESVDPIETITMIPTPGSFPGMPATRWWEFEDGNVNIAGNELAVTDTVKSVLTEFALVYQDDWFVLPKVMPVGSIAKVKGIVVKDVFGQHTLVQHTSKSPGIDSDWSSWDLYSQSEANVEKGVNASDDSLFLAPSTHHIMMSDALEEIVFIRDEMANMVFAIEKKFMNELGDVVNADDAASALKEFLLKRNPATIPVTPGAELRYELGNTVPFNWIPFVPVHQGANTNRAVKLQRASMPLILSDYDQIAIRPRSEFLRYGISDDDTLNGTGSDVQFFIAEEIVPRAGIRIEKKLQRTRWFNGKTFLWLSNSKTVGKGQGNSNLQFDRVLDTKAK